MEEWFLEIYDANSQKEPQGEPKALKIFSFLYLEAAWHYVLENKIQSYLVYKAKCVIDAT
jgi:hypothetical protein